MSETNDFLIKNENLRVTAVGAIETAKGLGATGAVAEVSESVGQSVSVRKGETETIEFSRDKYLGITVYCGKKTGNASTSDLSPAAVSQAVEAAYTVAKFTQEDEFAGLPDEKTLAKEIENLDLFHPQDMSIGDSLELAKQCEDAAFLADKKVENSDGATLSTNRQRFVLANSLGFVGGYPSTQHSLSCSVVAGRGEKMQRDHWWTVSRNFAQLEKAHVVGKKAGIRAAQRVGARKIKTQKVPIIYDSTVSSSILGHFVSAISGGALYKKQSFLVDSLGKKIFPDFVEIYDRPRLRGALGSSPFDQEGVYTTDRKIVDKGEVKGYFLSTYSAKKLGLESTGNAGGDHNLEMMSTGESFEEILGNISKGFLVTEMLGMGVNGLTGDYSRGAAGFWIENGELAFPVNEVTIAGNLKDMFANINAVGTDKLARSSRQVGCLLIDGMTVAGD